MKPSFMKSIRCCLQSLIERGTHLQLPEEVEPGRRLDLLRVKEERRRERQQHHDDDELGGDRRHDVRRSAGSRQQQN